MENRNKNVSQKNKGFALLITIMVVSVVVAVTLAIVELSIKQLELSVDSVDSELAFQAANAGLECARYWRREVSDQFESGDPVTFDCFGTADGAIRPPLSITRTGNGVVTVYTLDTGLSWGTAPLERCSDMTIISMVVPATTTAPGVTIGSGSGNNSLKTILPGYPSDSKTCEPGGLCTIVSVTGYSANCSNKNDVGTQRREILLEF